MAIDGVSSSSSIQAIENGTEKLRGLENAAVQRAKHDKQVPPSADTQVSPSVVVELGRPRESSGTYAPPIRRVEVETVAKAVNARATENVQATEQATADQHLAEGASVRINEHVRNVGGTTGSSVVVGEGASLKINSHLGTAAGTGGTIVVNDGASLKINAHVGSAGPEFGTIVVGEAVSMQLNIHATAVSGGSLLAAQGDSGRAEVKIDAVVAAANAKSNPVAPAAIPAVTNASNPVQPVAASLRAFEAVQPLESQAVKQADGRGASKTSSSDNAERAEDPRWAAYRQIVEGMQNKRGKQAGHKHGGGHGHA
jgi:hypothetical protein